MVTISLLATRRAASLVPTGVLSSENWQTVFVLVPMEVMVEEDWQAWWNFRISTYRGEEQSSHLLMVMMRRREKGVDAHRTGANEGVMGERRGLLAFAA